MIAEDIFGIIASASNIRIGGNPEYTKEDFLKIYPQFGKTDDDGNPLIPEIVFNAWLKLAYSSIHKNRWGEMWEIGISLYLAHWLTLYLQNLADEDDSLNKIVNAGLSKGLQTSKSADGLSVSYDFGTVSADFAGWGVYKQTSYGQQFVTLAKNISLGGMVVW